MYPILLERPVCTCAACGVELYEGQDAYYCDEELCCEGCAEEWMEEQWKQMRRTLTR